MPDSISDTHFLRRGACNPLYFRQQTQSLINGKNAKWESLTDAQKSRSANCSRSYYRFYYLMFNS